MTDEIKFTSISNKPRDSVQAVCRFLVRIGLWAVLSGLIPGFAAAQVNSPVQSSARPFGLNIVDTVKAFGSDAKSATFQRNTLPHLQNMVNTNLRETKVLTNANAFRLDPAKLKLSTATDARVYFVGEGAGYHNTLGFNTGGPGIETGDPKLIFPDASSSADYLSPNVSAVRTQSTPLLSGDFVNLGTFQAGTQLDFFLIGNGANGGRNVYSTQTSYNKDHLDHVRAFGVANSPYLMISFEDLYGGGDRDYNDVVFALDIGADNVSKLIGPEPGIGVLLCAFLIPVFLWKRRIGKAAR